MNKKWINIIGITLAVYLVITISVPNLSFASTGKRTLTGVIQLSGTNNSVYAINKKGELWTWGYNQYGNLGLGDEQDRFASVHLVVSPTASLKQVSSGRHINAVLTSEGKVMSWSEKWPGQSAEQSRTPVIVEGFSGIKQIAAGGNFVLGLDQEGKIWAWGSNESGQIPGANHGFINKPAAIQGLPDHIKAITASENGGYALTSEGKIWFWQASSQNKAPAPVLLKGLPSIQSIHEGGKVLAAIDQNQHGWIYDPDSGKTIQLAITQPIQHISAQQINNIAVVTKSGKIYSATSNNDIRLLNGYPANNIAVQQNSLALLVLTRSGEVWSAGNNVNGQLGIDSTVRHIEQPQPVVFPIQLNINGKSVHTINAPTMINNTIYVPIRGVLQEIGATVSWSPASRNQVIIKRKNTTIQLNVNQTKAVVNGKSVTLDAPAKNINGSVMVPLRFISQAAGAKVNWDQNTYTAAVTTSS